ncbi:MAG: hypothetical protein NTV17_09725 [Burkholderiales bacterium]|nr:hypothetical protein [Burkholderiales bacterium]
MTLRPSTRQPVRCNMPFRSRRATLALLLATAWLGSATGVQAQTGAASQSSAVTGGFGSNSGHMNTSNWYDDRWYLSALVGYVWTDSSRQAGNGVPYGFAVGKPISPNWNLELRGLYEKLDGQTDGPGNYRNWTASVDEQWFFMGRSGSDRWNAIQPYAVAGMGLINDKNQVKSGTSLMAHGGIGATWAFSRWGRLVVDGRYRFDDNRDKVNRGRHLRPADSAWAGARTERALADCRHRTRTDADRPACRGDTARAKDGGTNACNGRGGRAHSRYFR